VEIIINQDMVEPKVGSIFNPSTHTAHKEPCMLNTKVITSLVTQMHQACASSIDNSKNCYK
jgi:hypothetical protein